MHSSTAPHATDSRNHAAAPRPGGCPFAAAFAGAGAPAPRSSSAPVPIPLLVALLEASVDPVTGFLPARTPRAQLPAPFDAISAACRELPERYHGHGLDVRPWLDAGFATVSPAWPEAVANLDDHTVEALMTQVSLLCHAYRWQSAPPRPELYRIDALELPAGLDWLWTAVAERMSLPRVGVFYTMVCNNWRLAGRAEGQPYHPDDLASDDFELVHSWLRDPERDELRAFIRAAVGIESRGAAASRAIAGLYRAIDAGDDATAADSLEALAGELAAMRAAFNREIRTARMRPAHFATLVQPTMIWLLDHGDGPLEGASGPQSCVVQLVDSVLGVPRTSQLGAMLLGSRRYMLPRHRRLLDVFDGAGAITRGFVLASTDPRVRAAYDACIDQLARWRRSHRQRGAMYIRGDADAPAATYASTGLAVGVDDDRVATFEATMDGHIANTTARRLDAGAA